MSNPAQFADECPHVRNYEIGADCIICKSDIPTELATDIRIWCCCTGHSAKVIANTTDNLVTIR